MSSLKLTKTQQESLEFCKEKDKAILALEPGCGKTISAISIAKMKGYKKVYLITPPKLKSFDDDNLKNFNNYFKIKKVSHGSFKSRFNKSERVRQSQIDLDLYNSAPIIDKDYIIVIDEAHKFKNIESNKTRSLYALLHKNHEIPCFMLTGTIRPNMNCDASNLACMNDFWFYKDKPKHDNSFESFVNRLKIITSISYYFSPLIKDGMFFKRINRHTDSLYRDIKKIAFFAKKDNKSKKIIKSVKFKYTSMQSSLLDQMKGRKSILVGSFRTNVTHQSKSRVMDGHLLLKHIYENQNKEINFVTNKTKYLKEFKGKAIVFTQFIHTARYLAKELQCDCHIGKLSNKKSNDIVKRFLSSDTGLLIATIDSLSTGFDMERCNNIIFYSFSYNYANFIQSFDRIHRIVSTEDKNYTFLIYDDEEKKLNTSLSKMDLHFEWLNN